jgi:hypothetical protein
MHSISSTFMLQPLRLCCSLGKRPDFTPMLIGCSDSKYINGLIHLKLMVNIDETTEVSDLDGNRHSHNLTFC